ncbi:methyl-accepting chemotaxis protein [Parasedimentitalea psychrophila]|uniref:Methyl-accepting chemotaxis protein n=1 Tax=Parasedimentitalea psychrophila TaxID=2997337 RepID=A0A9Y2KZN6_9RHOB|nr:methyl-accepting chemotaxis protein [Parasedimentitalea psychrophila]WIY25633.1 methyl-accepting chemotaxis protein [Parasedimentitalea psychrophila]
MSLRSQILLLVTLPLIVLVFIGGLKGSADLDRYRSAQTIQSETHEALTLINLVHFLQVERGQSAALISSQGTVFKNELVKTRLATKASLAKTPASTIGLFPQLTKMNEMRKSVDALTINTPQMAAYYSGVINQILTQVGGQLVLQDNPEIVQIGSGLIALSTAKEAAGVQRAAGATGFGLGRFELPTYQKFAEKGATEAQLLRLASLTLGEYFADLDFAKGLRQSRLQDIRSAVLAAGPNGPVPDLTAQEWFSRATSWLTYLHSVENMIAANMDALAGQQAQSARTALLITITLVLLSVLASTAIGVRLILTFTRQFGALQKDLDKLAHKEFDFEPAFMESKTEIGHLSRAMNITRAALKTAEDRLTSIEQERVADRGAVIGRLDQHLSRLAARDLNCTIDDIFPRDYEQLRESFNTTVATLRTTVEQVVDAADSIRSGAAEISQASDDLSNRTESQAATLEQTAAALEQMTVSVKSSAEGAHSVEIIMDEARQEATNSGEVVQKTVSAMKQIEQSSGRISQIISVIDDIAFQTNLLALNAGVEAARAGEAGRGFAVVASEVRALAQRSSDAATEIKSLINDSARHVENGVDLVGQAGKALGNIVDRVNHISQLVTEIAEGSAEQSTGLGEINIGVTQLDQVTQQNAAMVEQATAAGHLLNDNASKLAAMVAQFKISKNSHRAVSRSNRSSPKANWELEENTTVKPAKVVGLKAGDWQEF